MDFSELCNKRYSVRKFLPDMVEKEKVDYILECARLAPSACNKQPWFFFVVTSEKGKNALQEAYPRDWFNEAPLYIVVCGDHSQSWVRSEDNKDHCDIDIAIAAEHICLAAESIGLGTCWVCNYNPERLDKYLELSVNIRTKAIFPIGYIDKNNISIPEKNRKPISEITKWV